MGYALLGFILGAICKEMGPFQQGLPSCVTNLYPNDSINPCSERYSSDRCGREMVSVVPGSFLPLALFPSQFLEENNDTMWPKSPSELQKILNEILGSLCTRIFLLGNNINAVNFIMHKGE